MNQMKYKKEACWVYNLSKENRKNIKFQPSLVLHNDTYIHITHVGTILILN